MTTPAASEAYDDRSHPGFAAVQKALKGKLTLFVGVMLLAFMSTVATIWIRGIGPGSPRDWLLLGLLIVVAAGGVLGAAIIPRPRHYLISDGVFEYPRWGGMRRGHLPLSEVDAFRREGRDPKASTVVLFSGRRRVFLVPENLLASPEAFLRALRASGLSELPSKFRFTSRTR